MRRRRIVLLTGATAVALVAALLARPAGTQVMSPQIMSQGGTTGGVGPQTGPTFPDRATTEAPHPGGAEIAEAPPARDATAPGPGSAGSDPVPRPASGNTR